MKKMTNFLPFLYSADAPEHKKKKKKKKKKGRALGMTTAAVEARSRRF
jgi:hypothetical protein